MFKKILVVCVGNICRSPTAEYLFRHHLADGDVDITSAGLAGLENRPMDATALQLLVEHGIEGGEAHRGRLLTSTMLYAADLVLVMEESHAKAIYNMAPEVSGKTFLLGKWRDAQDIPDPYRQHRVAFEHVYRLTDRGVSSWLRYL